MGPLLRPARAGDAPGLAELAVAAGQRTRSAEYFERFCESLPAADRAAASYGLVAVGGSSLLGYLLYSRVMDQAEVLDVLVLPASRGRGLGRQLLIRALADMRRSGARRCLLEVRASNTTAIALYLGAGFEHDGRRAGYYPAVDGRREDALLMSKEW